MTILRGTLKLYRTTVLIYQNELQLSGQHTVLIDQNRSYYIGHLTVYTDQGPSSLIHAVGYSFNFRRDHDDMLTLDLIVLFVCFVFCLFKQNVFHLVYNTLTTRHLDTSSALTKRLSSLVRVTSYTVSTDEVMTIC